MFRTISNIMKVSDLRSKILFTLLMLIVFRVGSFVPVPFINVEALKMGMEQSSASGVFGFLNTFTGNALSNFSILAMGIMPYITASIIVQLLTMDVIPKFAQWAREGEIGKRKLAQFTRYGTVVLGLIQAVGMSIAFNNQYQMIIDPSFLRYTVIAIVLTAGTAFLMWLGEQITEKGIGNGISIIIFGGIVAGMPSAIQKIYVEKFTGEQANLFINTVIVLVILLVVIAIIAGVIFIQQGTRKIPVQYAKRVVGRKMYGGQSTHIPLKVNSAGVIPVIFAMSITIFPPTIASFWPNNGFARWVVEVFDTAHPFGMMLYVLLIIAFSYFYTFVQINPMQMSENMKKNGGFIPGIRPGKPTAVYLTRVLNRITLTGSIFLALVAILPVFFIDLAGLPQSVKIGGTSLLIVIGVALETMKTIESQLIKRHYEGFIKK